MRILRVAPYIYPDTKGGGAYHVFALSRDQAAMGHDVTVLTVCKDESQPRVEETDGFTILRVSPGVTLLGNNISLAVARYLWGVDSEDFDVIHAHSHIYFSTNLAALKRRLGDIPLAITNHGLYSQSAPEWTFDIYLKTLGQWTFNQADVVFCYTETDKERVQAFGVSSRIEVVSNGIDTERFTPDGSQSELLDANGPVVLFVGRFVEGKRPELAVEAFAEVVSRYPDAEMYLCGDGPLRDSLETQVRELGIEHAVTFLGHVSYDEMPKVYRGGVVLVLPSRAEGVPRTVLEAMASGLQVVMSDLEQVVPMLGGQGHIVSDPTCKSFVEALKTAIEDYEPDSDHVTTSDYRWDETVDRTTQILQSLFERN